MLQWKVLVGAMFLAVAARVTVAVILCCHTTVSMVTSAAIIQAALVAANLWNSHKLLSFAFTVENTSFVIISGLWTLLTFELSEIVVAVLTVHGEGPHSTAWKVGYAFAVTIPGWIFLYIRVCIQMCLHSHHAPQMHDIVQALPAVSNTQARAAEYATSGVWVSRPQNLARAFVLMAARTISGI